MGLLAILEIIACAYAGGRIAKDAGYCVTFAAVVCVFTNVLGLALYFVLWLLSRAGKGVSA